MKNILFAAIAASAFILAPAALNTATAQTTVQERTVVRGDGDRGMHRGYMHRRHMWRGQRCFKERTRIYRGGRQVTIVKRVCR